MTFTTFTKQNNTAMNWIDFQFCGSCAENCALKRAAYKITRGYSMGAALEYGCERFCCDITPRMEVALGEVVELIK